MSDELTPKLAGYTPPGGSLSRRLPAMLQQPTVAGRSATRSARREWTVPAVVDRVVDGDTVYVVLDLGWHISLYQAVRVAGINCPELATEAGKAARARAVELLPVGTRVVVVSHSLDKYGRVLGTIRMPDGTSYGELMVAGGFAVVAPW